MENIEKEIEDCFSLLFYFEWATSNSCPKPLAALAQPYRSLGHSRAPRHSSTCTLCWSPPAAPPQVSTEGTAVSLGARHGCSYGLTDDTSFQASVWWRERTDLYEQHLFCYLLACWNQWVEALGAAEERLHLSQVNQERAVRRRYQKRFMGSRS